MHAGFECIVRVGSLSSSFQPSRCQLSAGPAEPELPDNPIKVQLGQRFGSYRLLPALTGCHSGRLKTNCAVSHRSLLYVGH